MFLLRRILAGFASESEACLSTPLTSVAFSCSILGSYARTEVTQVFRNAESAPIECEYVLPVLENSTLSRMTVTTADGRVLDAHVEEVEEAKERYSDAISEGNQAMIGRMEGEGIMVLSIGNMAPQSTLEVRFTVLQVVGCSGDQWVFEVPATLFPVIQWGNADDSQELTTVSYVRPQDCGYRLHFETHIRTHSEIGKVACDTHPLLVVRTDDRCEVILTSDPAAGFLPGKDLRIVYDTAESMTPHISIELNPETEDYTGMLAFLPPLLDVGEVAEDLTGYGEFLYILDRSGSMAGSRIEMAKQSALLFLKSLPTTSTFNIISFGSDIDLLFPEPQPYNSSTVAYALRALSQFTANLGGTNILLPLDRVFRTRPDPRRPRAVFLLTDGEVPNPEAVIGFVEAHSKQARFFPFGIGHEVSVDFLRYIAKAGNGVAAFISHLDDIKSKVITVLQKCMVPSLTNIQVQWPGKDVQQFPSNDRLATCYFGEVFTVMARFGKQQPTAGSIVTISAQNSKNGDELQLEVAITPQLASGNDIYKLWGKAALRELFFAERQTRDSSLKREIIELSIKCGVPSMYTAFLCVEQRTDAITGQMQLRKVPICLNTDRKLINRMTNMATPHYRHAHSQLPRAILGGSSHTNSSSCCGGGGGFSDQEMRSVPSVEHRQMSEDRETFHVSEADFHTDQTLGPSSVLMKILSMQQVDGSWELASLPDDIHGFRAVPQDFADRFGASATEIWATIVIVTYLGLKFASSEGEWRLIALKAKKWLKSKQVNIEEHSLRVRQAFDSS